MIKKLFITAVFCISQALSGMQEESFQKRPDSPCPYSDASVSAGSIPCLSDDGVADNFSSTVGMQKEPFQERPNAALPCSEKVVIVAFSIERLSDISLSRNDKKEELRQSTGEVSCDSGQDILLPGMVDIVSDIQVLRQDPVKSVDKVLAEQKIGGWKRLLSFFCCLPERQTSCNTTSHETEEQITPCEGQLCRSCVRRLSHDQESLNETEEFSTSSCYLSDDDCSSIFDDSDGSEE